MLVMAELVICRSYDNINFIWLVYTIKVLISLLFGCLFLLQMWFSSCGFSHGIRINFIFISSVFLHFDIAVKTSLFLAVCVRVITVA